MDGMNATVLPRPGIPQAVPGRGPGEIRALTSLRGIAAMAVVLQHFSATAQERSAVPIPSLVPHGYVAVDLFFVLSGFIMSYTYLADFQARGRQAYAGFLAKRVARIVPLNTAVLSLFLAAGWLSSQLLGRNILYSSGNPAYDALANLFMVQGLGIGRNLNGPSWSISTEFAAYLLFPLFVLAVFSARRAVSAAALLAGVALLCGVAATQRRLGLGVEGPPLSLVRCFAEFAIGMGAYRLSANPAAARLLARDSLGFALIIACALSMLLRIDLLASLLFAPLVAALARNQGRVARMMSWSVPHFLGVVSFSLYLIHQLFRPIDREIIQALHPAPLSGPQALLFALLAAIAVLPFAALTYTLVERPGRVLVRHLLRRRPEPRHGQGLSTAKP